MIEEPTRLRPQTVPIVARTLPSRRYGARRSSGRTGPRATQTAVSNSGLGSPKRPCTPARGARSIARRDPRRPSRGRRRGAIRWTSLRSNRRRRGTRQARAGGAFCAPVPGVTESYRTRIAWYVLTPFWAFLLRLAIGVALNPNVPVAGRVVWRLIAGLIGWTGWHAGEPELRSARGGHREALARPGNVQAVARRRSLRPRSERQRWRGRRRRSPGRSATHDAGARIHVGRERERPRTRRADWKRHAQRPPEDRSAARCHGIGSGNRCPSEPSGRDA